MYPVVVQGEVLELRAVIDILDFFDKILPQIQDLEFGHFITSDNFDEILGQIESGNIGKG